MQPVSTANLLDSVLSGDIGCQGTASCLRDKTRAKKLAPGQTKHGHCSRVCASTTRSLETGQDPVSSPVSFTPSPSREAATTFRSQEAATTFRSRETAQPVDNKQLVGRRQQRTTFRSQEAATPFRSREAAQPGDNKQLVGRSQQRSSPRFRLQVPKIFPRGHWVCA